MDGIVSEKGTKGEGRKGKKTPSGNKEKQEVEEVAPGPNYLDFSLEKCEFPKICSCQSRFF